MQRWVNKLRQSDKQIFFEISNLVPLTFRIKGNMVRSWLLSDKITNIHLPNEQTPNVPVSVNELKSLGVLYYQLNPNDYEKDLQRVRDERGYNYADTCLVNREKMPNYEEKVKMFAEEHLHTDEEIRFVVEGSGYFDVRNLNDQWVRILVEPGDLIIVPAGIYHRFVIDTKDYIKVIRLFCGEPVWTPHNRPADEMPARNSYLQMVRAN